MADELQLKLEKTFISESSEILESMENDILELEQNPDQEDIKNSLLRSAHTLKGSSGMVSKDLIPEYIHSYEETIKTVLSKKNRSDDDFSFLLKQLDYITNLIDNRIKEKKEIDMTEYNNNLAQLKNFDSEDNEPKEEKSKAFGFFEDEKKESSEKTKTRETVIYRITFALTEKRMDHTWLPEHIVDDIYKAGKILSIKAQANKNLNWKKSNFIQCYFKWIIVMQTEKDYSSINDIFLFFAKNNEISIELMDEESVSLLGEIFIAEGKIEKKDLKTALDSKQKIGEVLLENKKITEKDLDEALKKQKKIKSEVHVAEELKISTRKVDFLIDLVGELVIANSNLSNIQNRIEDLDLEQVQYNINKISRQMRDNILSLKMVPIGQLLARFYRIVRDLSKEFGKQIDLVLEGESTELDKTMFTILQEPLLHLIRNSLDHGIETPEERKKANKNERGKIIIRAFQESGQIVIEIEDDGKGLDKEKILAKAIEKKILSPDRNYADEQIFNTIFEPGFSTKDTANLVSGRGIGMDAVLAGINNLNGSIKTRSFTGRGTIFTIQLPLTLAIIEGFLLQIGTNYFVIPLQYIAECFEIDNSKISEDKNVYNLRGEYLNIIQLNKFFKNIQFNDNVNKKVVVVYMEKDKIGLVVDEIIGNIQAVIKPLSRSINKSQILAGSTILGDGAVALIIDVMNLFTKFKIENNKLLDVNN